MDVTVIVATFGDESWARLAQERAIPSAVSQGVEVNHVEGDTLHEARNFGAAQATTEWLCFLDADDELEPGYFEAMAMSSADLRAPYVRYVKRGYVHAPRIPEGTDDLVNGNRLVIGTLVRRVMFNAVGGFRDWAFYEDWDLWQRCFKAGATVEFTSAVYRAHMRPDSRNRIPTRAEKEAMHHAIRRSNFPELYEVTV